MNIRFRVLRLAAASGCTLLATAALAFAGTTEGTLDQSQETQTGSSVTQDQFAQGQTYTAGITGAQDRVDLLLSRLPSECLPDTPLVVNIESVAAGFPTGTVLASTTISAAAVPGNATPAFIPALFASPPDVVAGTQYAITLSSADTDCGYSTRSAEPGPYPDGILLRSINGGEDWQPDNAQDLAFRTYVVPAGPAPPVPPGGTPASANCAGRAATLVGTASSDTIVGTAGKDVIAALAGKDTVRGLAGNDRICGGKGKDTLKGGGGKDRLKGGASSDTLKGGGGKDTCAGGPGGDDARKCEVEKGI